MTFRERSQLLFSVFKRDPKASIRQLSIDSDVPKSSVHRHQCTRKQRVAAMGHDFFETHVGLIWLNKLVQAVIFIFGIHAHVGSIIIARFFEALQLFLYVGSAPSTIRKMKATTRAALVEYNEEQWSELDKKSADLEVHLGVDDTKSGDTRCLTMMELTSGVILTEEQAPNRLFKTWYSCVGKTIKKFKKVLALSSDGANALKQIGTTIKTPCVMDLFHLSYDITKLFKSKLSMAIKSLTTQLGKYKNDNALTKGEIDSKQAIRKRLSLAYKAKKSYKKALFSISTSVHPFHGVTPVTSEALNTILSDQLNGLSNIVKECDINDKYKLLNRAKKRIAPLASLNDLWFEWVYQSLDGKTNHSAHKYWAKNCLLPCYYWEQQVKKTRKRALKKYYQWQLRKAKQQLENDPLTSSIRSDEWNAWATSMSQKYHRTTSAIEGRNARLTEHHFNIRDLNPQQLKALTIIHNFWIKRDDHTTAIERLFKTKPPDVFEWLTEHINYLPLPRVRQLQTLAA